jgi:DNA-binding response OmpR family regulator
MEKVLVIDDSMTVQALIADILKSQYELNFQDNGLSGINAAQTISPDLILLDIHMPGIDGFEVCKILKNSESCRDIPIIFLTSLASELEKVKGFQAGADDYVVKPFYRQELLARIKAHLAIRNSKFQALRLERLTVFKEMAVAISHEINNPLTTIYTFLHILQNELSDPSDSTKTALAGISEEIDRIHQITSKLADSSKANTVKYSKDISMIDLHDL